MKRDKLYWRGISILLAVLAARSAGLMKRALRSGADEILFLPLDPGEATRALLKISEARCRPRAVSLEFGHALPVQIVDHDLVAVGQQIDGKGATHASKSDDANAARPIRRALPRCG